jgi:DNA uptake protein ComE-like DNA-binding protein
VFLLSLSIPVNAQPIAPEDDATTDTAEAQPEEGARATDAKKSSAGRIIPPDEFGKYVPRTEEESDLNKDAIIERLRADSASMRIRYEERLRQLRSDSQAMRATIQKLRKKVRTLKRANRGSTRDTEPERDTTPTLRSEDRTLAQSDTRPGSETTSADTARAGETDAASGSGETSGETADSGPDAPLNPNTASLSDLRSVPGLSDRLAERIEWYRREVTPFDNLQDLRRVPGIDRQTFKQIQEYFHEGPY